MTILTFEFNEHNFKHFVAKGKGSLENYFKINFESYPTDFFSKEVTKL